jgi:hypothetical protein
MFMSRSSLHAIISLALATIAGQMIGTNGSEANGPTPWGRDCLVAPTALGRVPANFKLIFFLRLCQHDETVGQISKHDENH